MHIHIIIDNQYRYFTCNSYEKLLKIFKVFYSLKGNNNRIKVINKKSSKSGKNLLTRVIYTSLGMREEVIS